MRRTFAIRLCEHFLFFAPEKLVNDIFAILMFDYQTKQTSRFYNQTNQTNRLHNRNKQTEKLHNQTKSSFVKDLSLKIIDLLIK